MRLFTAVTLGPAIEARTTEELHRLRPLAPQARWVKREGLHLTLVFLGDVDDARLPAIREALAPIGARHSPSCCLLSVAALLARLPTHACSGRMCAAPRTR